MSLSIVTQPTVEPVTLEEAKAHLRIDGSEEDDLIQSWITAARMHAESYTRRQLINTTVRIGLDGFTDEIAIPVAPLSSVSSITYVDTNGATQTLAASVYQVDTYSEPGRVTLAYNQTWPNVRTENFNAVQINAVIGYGATPNLVPAGIRSAIRLLVGHWYEHREAVAIGSTLSELPMAVESLLYPFRMFEFA